MKRTDGVYWKSTKGASGSSLVVAFYEVQVPSGKRVFSIAYGKGKTRKQAIKSASNMASDYLSRRQDFGVDYEDLKELFISSLEDLRALELSYRSTVSLMTREDFKVDGENLLLDTMKETGIDFMYNYGSLEDTYYMYSRYVPIIRYYSKTWKKS